VIFQLMEITEECILPPMCRWLAYSGPPLLLDALLIRPANALVRQALAARQGITPVNGDGFGVAWWGDRPEPGVFRDTLPAWNDSNLLSLAEQISAKAFFAHVRASTGTATSRSNCHPFRFGRFAFMHNGQIGGWPKVRRRIEAAIPDDLYGERYGTTDTEALFLLALAHGLAEDPAAGLRDAISLILEEMRRAKVEAPFRMTAAIGNGSRIVAARWSSDGNSPTLYYQSGSKVTSLDGRIAMSPGKGAAVILSEPLDGEKDWPEIPEASVLTADVDGIKVESFQPG
jgi:predicted glutamine amidotransferase